MHLNTYLIRQQQTKRASPFFLQMVVQLDRTSGGLTEKVEFLEKVSKIRVSRNRGSRSHVSGGPPGL